MEAKENNLVETAPEEVDDLSQLLPDVSVEELLNCSAKRPVRKPRTRKQRKHRGLALPHLQEHKTKRGTVYSYRRGEDKEIYLGHPDFILQAVMEKKEREC